MDAALLMIDPPLTTLDGQYDTHRDSDMKRALRPLTVLAAETGVAVLTVRHPNKGQTRDILRPGGSIGITGTARISSVVAVDPDDPERRLLLPVKSNVGARPDAWGFSIASVDGLPRIMWDATSKRLSADEVLSAEHVDAADRSALAEVSAWLADAVALGPRPVKELQADARAAGFACRTVEAAKAGLGMKASKHGFGHAGVWTWGYADHELPT
jgi:putative DNA primase/helicase